MSADTMEPAERIEAARRALVDLDEASKLESNRLLEARSGDGHDHLRARILRAIESLDPGLQANAASGRRFRHHQILTRCDVHGESHKEVAAALGLSRRQFYRDRREALLALADAIEDERACARAETVDRDPLDMQLDFIQALRGHGRYDAVWRECTRVLADMRGHEREVEVWSVASEAARCLGNVHQAKEAIAQMRRVAATSPHDHLRRASSMRVAVADMAIDWMEGEPVGALEKLADVALACGSERSMYGRDATLFAILLAYGATINLECGEWRKAEELTRRSERIIDRSEVPHAKSTQYMLRGRLALRRDGDVRRSKIEFRDALEVLSRHHVLPAIATCAVEYGLSLVQDQEVERGVRHIEYGLRIGREVSGYDEFAVTLASAAPTRAGLYGGSAALESIAESRARAPLSARASLYALLAEGEVSLGCGDFETAFENGTEAGRALEAAHLLPAAAQARVLAAESAARSGRSMQARRLLATSRELVRSFGPRATRTRAQRLGAQLT